MPNFFCCSYRASKPEYENLSEWEAVHCKVEVCLECSIRSQDARREFCEKAACCFWFGRSWKMTNFICRSKIFSNMDAACTIFFLSYPLDPYILANKKFWSQKHYSWNSSDIGHAMHQGYPAGQHSEVFFKNDFSCFWSHLKWKSPPKTEESQNFREAPKSILETFLSYIFTFPLIFYFYVSYDPNFFYWRIP